tara:strand:+ start:60 stop:1076 length:1017 start_codon:yes stop_codon:yes gene_type:complete
MENTQNIKDLVQKFYPHAKNALGFEHPVRVIMRHDAENAEQSLGNTAYYDPEQKLIVLYVTNRHPKDILRSFSHELVHHAQNCRGDLDDLTTGGHYAEDGKGREIEKEAYLQGNLNVRDWEDSIKYEGDNQMNEHYQITKEELRKTVAEAYREIMAEKKAKPDFLDLDKDGDKKEPMEKAAKDKVEEDYSPSQDDEHADAQELGARLAKKKKVEEASVSPGALMKHVMSIMEQIDFSAIPNIDYDSINWDLLEGPLTAEAFQHAISILEQIDFSSVPNVNYDDIRWDLLDGVLKESKKESPKEIIKEVPQQKQEQPKETNKAWYNTSLYNKLMSKWTK